MLETEMGKFHTIDDFDLSGKRILVKVDLNSPLIDGKVQMNTRIKQHALTLKELSEKGAKVVALSHQGRPGRDDYLENLDQHASLLSQIVKTDYVDDLAGQKAVERIEKMESGHVILLRNVRSTEDEYKPSPDNRLVKTLSPLFDLFVSDAFSVAHRNQTSIVSFPQVISSCIGRLMEKELKAIKDLQSHRMLYIMGGAKPEDNLVLVKNQKVKKVLSTGIFSLLCLMAKGYKLGKEEGLNMKLIPEIIKLKEKIETPVDLAVEDNGRREIGVEELPVDKEILDIGWKTVKFYSEEIKNAEAVFFKGPAGKFEKEGFEKGTLGLLETIAGSDCFSLIGGGHSSHVIESFNISKDKFSHISLAGGALINYLVGKKLPGLEVLKV